MQFFNTINGVIPPLCQCAVQEVAKEYFHTDYQNLTVSILHGGYSHSNTCLLLQWQNKEYVLRVKKGGIPNKDLQRELYAMKATAELTIAPRVLYVSEDSLAVLIEYIPTHTLSLAQSRQLNNIKGIANALRAAHSIDQNPYFEKNGLESVVEAYDSVRDIPALQPDIDHAMQLIYTYDRTLENYHAPKVNIHGDLNPRNMLLYNEKVYLLDWDYVSWEDPLMDLSYLSLRLDYAPEEEILFLEYYLEHVPTSCDIDRYYICKQLNWAELAVYFFYFAIKNQHDNRPWDTTPVKEWSHFVKEFVDYQENVTNVSQYFYDMARICLAKTHDRRNVLNCF